MWNGPFKAKIRELYNIWMLNDANCRRKPKSTIHGRQAWDALPKEVIAKSFKDCGITNMHYGNEDDQIHCFKEKGSVPEGLQLLQDARFAAEDLPLIDEVDSDEDEENGYASDSSLQEKELEIYSQFV